MCVLLKPYMQYLWLQNQQIHVDVEDVSLFKDWCFVFQEEREENKVEGQDSSVFSLFSPFT